MVDALAAIGFAANILQFVDYICHVLKVGRQLRRQGMVESNQDLEQTARLLEHQVARIRSQQGVETGLDESDQALNVLAEECISIGKELTTFIQRFKIEQDSDPKTLAIAKQRAIHADEISLENEIRLLTSRVEDVEKIVAKRKAEEKKRKRMEEIAEKKRLSEEKRAARKLVSTLKDIIKRRIELVHEPALRTDEVDGLVDLRLKQKVELEKAMVKEQEKEHPPSRPQPEDKLKKRKPEKQEDEIELDQLRSLKQLKGEELLRVTQREDALFEQERRRTKDANTKLIDRAAIRRKISTLKIAIEFEWNKSKIEEFAEKLARTRNRLYSEVFLNMQSSVGRLGKSQAAMESMFQTQSVHLQLMDENASQRHDVIMQAINSFTEVLRTSQWLFPALPKILTEADPSLKPAALNGYDVIENAVLAALHFRRIDAREAQVQEAYPDTCSWIFDDPEDDERPWSNFRAWLEGDNGCYWVEGKAGCGKSTLMKFLYSDPRTVAALNSWAGASCEMITASYFCWQSGTPLQKNQEGLLRSLLHAILSRRRDLIARVFPRQYNAMMSKLFANNSSPDIFFFCDNPGCSSSFGQPGQLEAHQKQEHTSNGEGSHHDDDACGTLTLTELKAAFTTLARQSMKGFKICLFIDGLDEYVGDQLEIVNVFKAVIDHSSVIKAVISSRPEPIFVEAFHRYPSLRMEVLTAEDIKLYIRSQLLPHSRMDSRVYGSAQLVDRLVSAISTKASGVFLWVFLVVRRLLEYLSDGSYLEDLEGIIDRYPAELHELYEHMFARMKPLYRAEAYRLFQAIDYAQKVEGKIPSALRLSFVEKDHPEGALDSPLRILQTEELDERLKLFETRLRSRCCGLFEVQYYHGKRSAGADHIPEGKVVFLHRTVSDFLKDESVQQVIKRETRDISHEIYQRLMASILYWFKGWRFFHLSNKQEWKKFISDITSFLAYCQRCEAATGSDQTRFIDGFDKELQHFWNVRSLETRSKAMGYSLGNYDCHWAESILVALHFKRKDEPDERPLISLAARFGLCNYVRQKLHVSVTGGLEMPKTVIQWDQSAILRVCLWAMQDSILRPQYLEIVEIFLTSGMQVNSYGRMPSSARATTLWQELISLPVKSQIHSESGKSHEAGLEYKDVAKIETSEAEMLDVWTQLLELFVKFGASVDRNFGGKAGTARQEISKIMTALQARKGLSSEDLLARDRAKARMDKLLRAGPIIADTTKPVLAIEHVGNGHAQSMISSSQPTQRKKRRSIAQTKAPEPIESEEPTKTPSTHSLVQPLPAVHKACFQCKATNELTDIGFEPNEVLQAISKAGVGYDVPALASWILDHTAEEGKCSGSIDPAPSQMAKAPHARVLTDETTARPPTRAASPDLRKRQWAVVACHAKSPPTSKEVVGADFLAKPPKAKSRRARAKAMIASGVPVASQDESRTQQANGSLSSGAVAGAVELRQGTFTWFFESQSPHEGISASLTEEQTQRLEEFLRGL